jgi:hypothetical protein
MVVTVLHKLIHHPAGNLLCRNRRCRSSGRVESHSASWCKRRMRWLYGHTFTPYPYLWTGADFEPTPEIVDGLIRNIEKFLETEVVWITYSTPTGVGRAWHKESYLHNRHGGWHHGGEWLDAAHVEPFVTSGRSGTTLYHKRGGKSWISTFDDSYTSLVKHLVSCGRLSVNGARRALNVPDIPPVPTPEPLQNSHTYHHTPEPNPLAPDAPVHPHIASEPHHSKCGCWYTTEHCPWHTQDSANKA